MFLYIGAILLALALLEALQFGHRVRNGYRPQLPDNYTSTIWATLSLSAISISDELNLYVGYVPTLGAFIVFFILLLLIVGAFQEYIIKKSAATREND